MVKIGLDIDNVLLDTNKHVIDRIDKEFGVELDINEIEYGFANVEPEIQMRVYELFDDPEFMAAVPAINGAIEFAKRLQQDYHVVYITSVYPKVASQRIAWIRNTFRSNNIVITPLKHLIDVDILIDDYLLNFKGSPSDRRAYGIVYAQPYNKDTIMFRSNDFNEIMNEIERRCLINKHTERCVMS